MNINSGFKIVDKLAQSYGISCQASDNPFQLSVAIAADTSLYELRMALQPFDLKKFPHALWLSLQQQMPTNRELTIHRFRLPHCDQVICWLLLDNHGRVISRAFPLNKPKYIQAAKVILRSVLMRLNYI